LAIIVTHGKKKLAERPFKNYDDWYTTTMRVPKTLWGRFDNYCRARGTVRSKMLTCLVEEELSGQDKK